MKPRAECRGNDVLMGFLSTLFELRKGALSQLMTFDFGFLNGIRSNRVERVEGGEIKINSNNRK